LKQRNKLKKCSRASAAMHEERKPQASNVRGVPAACGSEKAKAQLLMNVADAEFAGGVLEGAAASRSEPRWAMQFLR